MSRHVSPWMAASAVIAFPAFADTYQLDRSHADLLFSIDHGGFTDKHGSFRELDASLTYDADRPDRSAVTVLVKTDSVDTGFDARDRELRGEKFLDVAKFPEMRFVSTRVTQAADGTLQIEGDLTLHGVTKPLMLHAKLNKSAPNPFDRKPTLGFSASGSLKRSDFGISTYLPVIGDVVTIRIAAEFNHTL